MNFNSFSIRIKLVILLSLSAAVALLILSTTFFYYIYNSEKESYIKSLTQLSLISSENIKPAIMLCNINVMLTRSKQGRTETLTTGTSNPLKSYFRPKLKKPTQR